MPLAGIADGTLEHVARDATLYQIVGGPGMHRIEVGLAIVLPRQHDHWRGAAAGARFAEQVEPCLAAEIEIQQCYIERLFGQQLESSRARARPLHGEPAAESFGEQLPGQDVIILVILHEEHAHDAIMHAGVRLQEARRS